MLRRMSALVLLLVLVMVLAMSCGDPQAQTQRRAYVTETIRDNGDVLVGWIVQVGSRTFLVNDEGGVIEVTQ